MFAKHYENPTMLSRVTAKNVGDVFFETHCMYNIKDNGRHAHSTPLHQSAYLNAQILSIYI